MIPKASPPAHESPSSMPQATVVLKGYTFQLLAPYEPGQVLGTAEAGLLNREWTQAVRLGFQQQVENVIAAEGPLTHAQIANLQLAFQHFADGFSFKALPQSRTGDPITKQKHDIARRVLDIHLNSTGQTRQSLGESSYQRALARLMNNPEVIRQAEQQLVASREAADQLAGLETL